MFCARVHARRAFSGEALDPPARAEELTDSLRRSRGARGVGGGLLEEGMGVSHERGRGEERWRVCGGIGHSCFLIESPPPPSHHVYVCVYESTQQFPS